MTLKTSLLITGDASVAKKAVEDLHASVTALGVGLKATTPATTALDQAQKEVAGSGKQAAAATEQVADATRKGAIGARDLTQATETGKAAQVGMGAATQAAAVAQAAQTQALAKTAEETRKLTAANDGVAASGVAVKQELAAIEAVQATAATGADAHAAAMKGLQGEVAAIVASVAGGQDVFEAMASHGDSVAAALTRVAEAGAGARGGVDAAGASGRDAAVDLGGLGDVVVDTAGKAEGMGGKLGSAAAIIAGPLGIAIGIGINLLGDYVGGLIDTSDRANRAAKAAADLGSYVDDVGNYFDRTTGRIIETNKALVAFAILSRSAERRKLEESQQAARDAGDAALRSSRKARVDGDTVRVTPGGAVMGQMVPGNRDIDAVFAAGKNVDANLLKIAQSRSTNAALAAEIVKQRSLYTTAARDIAKKDAEIQSLQSGALAGSLRTPAPARPAAGGGSGRSAGGAATGGAATGDGSYRTDATAQRAASDAAKEFQRDLDQVTARYLPAIAAAKDYADELARIDRLAAAYDPKNAASGLSPEQADAARAALRAANDKRMAEINATPESRAADDARKSIDGVIASLEREMAVRQTLDPVQRAMIEHQADLAKMSDEERRAYEAKLRALYQQEEGYRAAENATRAAAQAQAQLRDMALDAFEAIVVGGQSAGKVIERLAQTIASAAVEAALLGTGPLAAILKGGGATAATTGGTAGGPTAADLVGKSVGKSVGDRLSGLFGKGGAGTAATGQLLQSAGLGYTAAGITGGNQLGGAFGGALGGAIAGPLGSIAGGIVGGVVGKLIAGKPKEFGSAALTFDSGFASIGAASGRGAAEQAKASAFGSSVADSLNKIAEQLGAELGSASVSVGYRPGHKAGAYRVDTTGSGKVTGVQAFETEAEAVAFAIREAISDGVVQTSAAVQKALQSSTDVNKAVAEAVKVKALEDTMGGIVATIDKAFHAFEAQAKDRVRIATQYGFDLVAIEKRNGEDRAKLAAQLEQQQVGSLKKLIEEMTAGSLFDGSAIDRIDALNTAIAKAKVDLGNNVEGAADTLANLYQQRLSASKEAYGATARYAADRAATLDEARGAVAAANARIVAAQGAAAATSDPALTKTNATLDEIADQQAELVAAQKRTNALLTGLSTAGLSTAGVPIGTDLARLAAY